MQPPIETLHNFLGLHTEVRSEHLPWLWEAFLQWVRLHGRFDEKWYEGWFARRSVPRRSPAPPPSSRLCQPSLAVDDLWRLLAGGTIAWRKLPEQVQGMERVPVRDPHSRTNLYETYEKAYFDEYGPPLPLLFLVDELLGLYEGRLYRAECIADPVDWGVSVCPAESDAGRDPEPVGPACTRSLGSRFPLVRETESRR